MSDAATRPHPDPLPGGEGERTAPPFFELEVVANERVGPQSYVLAARTVGARGVRCRPGQFFQVRGWSGYDPLLRRPFTPLDLRAEPSAPAEDGTVRMELLCGVVGKGTGTFARLRPGDRMDAVGPLGRGFSAPPPASEGPVWIVAGGVGLAPFYQLARELSEAGRRDVAVVLGAREASGLVCADRFRALPGVAWRPATEKGDAGATGTAVDELEAMLATGTRPGILYSCGPEPMLRRVVEVVRKHKLPRAEVSVERKMACGFGVCFTCVCRALDERTGEYRNVRTCLDGPVLDVKRLPEVF